MAFDFPSSPTVGQSYTPAGGPTYVWNGSAWAQANVLASGVGRQTAIFNFSGAASPWAFRGFPPGVVGFDLAVSNAVSPAGGMEFYLQMVNSAGAIQSTNYRGVRMTNGTPALSNVGYAAISSAPTANCGFAGIVQFRKSGTTPGYWAYTSMGQQIGAAAMMWTAAGDITAALNDPQGFNFGCVTGGIINGGNCRVDYWTD